MHYKNQYKQLYHISGTVSVFFIISIVIYWSSIWGINVNLNDVSSPYFVPMYESTFPSLSGMLALGLFIHNAIVTITSNHEKPEKNVSRQYLIQIDNLCSKYDLCQMLQMTKQIHFFISDILRSSRLCHGHYYVSIHRNSLLHIISVAKIVHRRRK